MYAKMILYQSKLYKHNTISNTQPHHHATTMTKTSTPSSKTHIKPSSEPTP
jgi:hypothetical protein